MSSAGPGGPLVRRAVSSSAAWPGWGLGLGQGGHRAPLGAVPPAWCYSGWGLSGRAVRVQGSRWVSASGSPHWRNQGAPPGAVGSGACGVLAVQGAVTSWLRSAPWCGVVGRSPAAPSSPSEGRGGGPKSENARPLGVDPTKREPQKEHGTFEKPECSLGRPCTRMILSHRAFLSGDLKACRGWPGRAWAEALSWRHFSALVLAKSAGFPEPAGLAHAVPLSFEGNSHSNVTTIHPLS